jgi:hypothetical protein
MKLTEWLDKQPDYGLCDPPMDPQEALDFLYEYLIPDHYVCIPEGERQLNTAIVWAILKKYSRTFRKEVRRYKKKLKKKM